MIELPLQIDFSQKVVVITGAGGVLCGMIARAFAQAGAKVAALDIKEERVKELADGCKVEASSAKATARMCWSGRVWSASTDRSKRSWGPATY